MPFSPSPQPCQGTGSWPPICLQVKQKDTPQLHTTVMAFTFSPWWCFFLVVFWGVLTRKIKPTSTRMGSKPNNCRILSFWNLGAKWSTSFQASSFCESRGYTGVENWIAPSPIFQILQRYSSLRMYLSFLQRFHGIILHLEFSHHCANWRPLWPCDVYFLCKLRFACWELPAIPSIYWNHK